MFSMERVHQEVYEELYCIDVQHHPHEEEVGWLTVYMASLMKNKTKNNKLFFPFCVCSP